MVLTMTLRLAAAGLLASAAIGGIGTAAARNVKLSPSATEWDALVLVQSRPRPSTQFDRRGPGFRIPGVPGLEIPPVVVEQKPKIPPPVFKQCVAAEKVGTAVVTPMSQLPPPGICSGKQVTAITYAVGSYSHDGVYPDSGLKHYPHNYCVTCKYDGDFVKAISFKSFNKYEGAEGLKKLRCFRCPAKYVWSEAKGKCCPN